MELNLPYPFKAPYSRVMTGPLESVIPWEAYMVRGALTIPVVAAEDLGHRVYNPRFDLRSWQFNVLVHGRDLQTKSGRQWIEDEVRYEFYPQLAALWPIRMRVERFNY